MGKSMNEDDRTSYLDQLPNVNNMIAEAKTYQFCLFSSYLYVHVYVACFERSS